VKTIAILFDLAESTIHDIIHLKQASEASANPDEIGKPLFAGNRQILSNQEEDILLDWIHTQHCNGNCPTPRDVRVYAQAMVFNRSQTEIACTRDWWRSFKNRHQDRIETRICAAAEVGRTLVASADVTRYFAELRQVLQSLKTSAQLLNMDETGNGTRPDKGRHRRVVCSKLAPVEPHFREVSDVTHVSLVATVSLDGHSLKPFLVTSSQVLYHDQELSLMQSEFVTAQTTKGYLTIATMQAYIERVLGPYCQSLRAQNADPELPVYIIMDNCRCHDAPEAVADMAKWNIRPIWLPPHSTHFLQVLDVGLFGAFKTNYRNTRSRPTKPKLEGKLLRILKAWHITAYPVTIWNAWRAAGVHVTTVHEIPFYVTIDATRVRELIIQHCPDGMEFLRP
jgi:hypothetical protein